MSQNIPSSPIIRWIYSIHHALQLFILLQITRRTLLKKDIPQIGFSYPDNLRIGDPERGKKWLEGDFTLEGASIYHAHKSPFALIPPNNKWVESLHSFIWLHHVMSLHTTESTNYIAKTIFRWTQRKPFRNKIAWQPHIIAHRILSWSRVLPKILPHLSQEKQERIMVSMKLQARILAHTHHLAPPGIPKLQVAVAMAYSTFAVKGVEHHLHPAIHILCKELKKQILNDGGHITRTPDALLPILADLYALYQALDNQEITIPLELSHAIERISSITYFFCYPDGKLPVFNGSIEGNKVELKHLMKRNKSFKQKFTSAPTSDHQLLSSRDSVLRSKSSKQKFTYAPTSGYQLLSSRNSVLMVDVGNPPLPPFNEQTHFAPLSIEFIYKIYRIFVNCGPNLIHGTEWRNATRMPAAHNTLSFQEPYTSLRLKHSLFSYFKRKHKYLENNKVHSRRIEDKTGYWLETSHEGYIKNYGIIHHRNIYLSADGLDLRGEDLLFSIRKQNIKPYHFAIRFHLHPRIKVSISKNHKTIMLILPNGEGWKFQITPQDDLSLSIEKSVYMGEEGIPQHTNQIVITGHTKPDKIIVNWAFRFSSKDNW